MFPNFIIIGAMNSGTTSLFNYISAHPDIIPASPKEPSFFITDRNYTKGLEWYKSIFTGNGKYAFEASVNYTKRHEFIGVPKLMHDILPNIKLIYLLRDPIERTITHYVWRCKSGLESRPFSKVIKTKDCHIVNTSKYYYQIKAYLRYYNNKQILFLDSEVLKNNPRTIINQVFDFLEIPPFIDKNVFKMHYNKSINWKRPSALEKIILANCNNSTIQYYTKKAFWRFRKTIVRPTLSLDDREILETELKQDAEEIRILSGIEFAHWSI